MKKFKIISFIFIFLGGLMFNSSISAAEKNNLQQSKNEEKIAKAKQYEKVVDSYLRGLNEQDLEGILSLYADDATVEDPVGSNIISGMKALRKFYSGAVTMDLSL